jgi:hypothetical protein
MKKETATRFSVSLAPTLLEQLDEMTAEKGYDNRSLAIADMIRAQLIEHRQNPTPVKSPAPLRWSMIITSRICRPASPTSSMTTTTQFSPPSTSIWITTTVWRF